MQPPYDTSGIKDEICKKFAPLVESGQLIVREDLFVNALDMSGESLEKLKAVVLEVGKSYPEFGEELPIEWMMLQEKIFEMKRRGTRIISFSKLQDLNREFEKPLEETELSLFASFLHQTGYILYIQEGSLKDTILLDAQFVIDAMKCFITCSKFAIDIWGQKEWQMMVSTGKMTQAYIENIWKKRNKATFYHHRKYLLDVMESLDLISRPKLYNKGRDVTESFFYVPCMLKADVPECMRKPTDADVTIMFRFREILPPAVFNRLVCSCLTLWEVEAEGLYDGLVSLRSGRAHILILKREFQTIRASIMHRTSQENIDIHLCRSFTQYLIQTIQRIISIYYTSPTSVMDADAVYSLQFNAAATQKGVDVDECRVIFF